VIVADFFLFFW